MRIVIGAGFSSLPAAIAIGENLFASTSGRATTKTGTSFRYAPLSSVYIRNAVTLDSQNDDYKRRQQSGSKSSLNRKDALVIGGKRAIDGLLIGVRLLPGPPFPFDKPEEEQPSSSQMAPGSRSRRGTRVGSIYSRAKKQSSF